MMLEYGKAILENVCEQVCVVRDCQLRTIFSHDLKILSWVFCARGYEEILPHQLMAPQVGQLVLAACKYQNLINDNSSNGISLQDLGSNCIMLEYFLGLRATGPKMLPLKDLWIARKEHILRSQQRHVLIILGLAHPVPAILLSCAADQLSEENISLGTIQSSLLASREFKSHANLMSERLLT